jgi:hypothetical protein
MVDLIKKDASRKQFMEVTDFEGLKAILTREDE